VGISEKLDEFVAMVENARAMPMSASCIVNRNEMLEAVEELRKALPEELRKARSLLRDRASVIEEGKAEVGVILAEAESERARLVSRTEVVKEATREAERLVAAANSESDRMRREVDDYVDGKLANFEIVLNRTLHAVEHGRNKINGRHELESLQDVDEDEELEPLPGA
jgi:regulator of protease activity HflC (stomatin/prohibitin superfamily)